MTSPITLLRGESKPKMTVVELRERQSWTLEQKIDHSLGTIEAFVNRMGGEDKVYVSFSGGKDSTVLFHLARRIYPNILGVFCNTGNEYPDIITYGGYQWGMFMTKLSKDSVCISYARWDNFNSTIGHLSGNTIEACVKAIEWLSENNYKLNNL